MNEVNNIQNSTEQAVNYTDLLPTVFSCKKIRAGKYKYRGWIISCVGYYEPKQRVCWEAYDPKTGCADFHGFSKRELKWLIDESLSKNGR